MKNYSVHELAQITGAGLEYGTSHTSFFTGVSIDSRTTKAGDCFFAVSGENFDGHNFLTGAFAKGAVCAVISKDIANKRFNGKAILRVKDTVKALGRFAAEYRRQGNFKVVAITGSVGKTTVRQIAYHLLSRHYHIFAAPKNFNNDIGLPLTLLGADPEEQIIIAELGSNHPGEIAYLTGLARPDIALVTNIYPAHLAGFGDLQTVIQEKLSISEGLQDRGIFIINADFDRLVDSCRARGIAFTTFGKSDGCDVQAQNITYKTAGSEFTIDGVRVYLPLPGPGNVENALAAWAVCRRLGMSIDDFARGIERVSAVPMRAEILQAGSLTVLNDCYNANPASMKNALDILTNLGSERKRRLVFICGDMAELGRQTEQLHAELGASVAQAKVRLLLAVGEFAQTTAQAAKRDAEYDLQTKCFKDTSSACNNLKEFIKDDDIILVKGSRTARLEAAVEKLKELFSSGVSPGMSCDSQTAKHEI